MDIVTGSSGTNYTGGNINDITTSTAWSGIGYSSQPYPFSCAISSINPSFIIGSSYNGEIVRWVPTISGWENLYNGSSLAIFPDSPSSVQVSFDPLGHCWVCVYGISLQYKIYKSINIPAYSPLPNASNNPFYDENSLISSNIPIACITFDLNNLNIVYGVQAVGGTGYLYKGFYNPVNRSIEWVTYRTDNVYCNYVLLSAYYTPTIPGVDNTKIYPINLLTHTVGAGVVVTGDVVKALSRDSTTQALYLGSIANNQIVQYSSNLTVVSNFGISNVLNVYTHDADAFDAGDVNIYDLQTYLTQINQCFLDVYSKFSGYTLTIPSLTLDPTTGRLTMIYDNTFEHVGNFGIYLNNSLLNYLSFSTQSTDVSQMNKLLLSYSGSSLQMKKSIFKLNQLDKIVLETSLNIVGDLTGNLDKSLTVFTEFDIDTSNPDLLQNDGDLLYAAVLLRNYVLNTTSALRSMNYSFYYQYKSGYKQKFFINSGENVSIKLQFTKKY